MKKQDERSFEEFDDKSPLRQLTARWRGEAEVLRLHGCEAKATNLERLADEVEEAVRAHLEQLFPVGEVAERTGYSVKYLRGLVRKGKIAAVRPNGDGGKIFIPRFAWPRKLAGDGEDSASDHHTGSREPDRGEESPADRAYQKVRGRGG